MKQGNIWLLKEIVLNFGAFDSYKVRNWLNNT